MLKLKILFRNKAIQFLGFLLLSNLFYWPAHGYGMVHDFLGWVIKYQNGDWNDVIHGFGYHGLHPVFHFFNYGFFSLFGLSEMAWGIGFASLHALAAYLLFTFLKNIFELYEIDNSPIISFLASLGFLFGPFQTEAITWNACMHYLLSTIFFLLMARIIVGFLYDSFKWSSIGLHLMFFVAAILTLEINLAAPFMMLIVAALYWSKKSFDFRRYVIWVFLPQVVVLVSYFLLNKIVLGEWVGHYGSEKHLNFSPLLLLTNGWKYFFKYSLLVHFWPYKIREVFYIMLENSAVIISITALALGVLIFIYRRFKNQPNSGFLSAGFMLIFFMGVFPIVNLYFMYLMPFQNDRYGHYASMFFYPAAVLLLYWMAPRMKWILVAMYIFLHIFFGFKNVIKCHQAGQIIDGLVSSFKWYDVEEVRLLSLPDNYKGLFLYADYHEDSAETFVEALGLFGERQVKGHVKEYSQYNQNTLEDSFIVKGKKDSITIAFAQYSNWFWWKNIGFINYEDAELKASRSDNQCTFIIKDEKEKVYLIPNGVEWREVRLGDSGGSVTRETRGAR